MKEGYHSPELSPAPAKRGKKEAKTHSLIGQVLEEKLRKKEVVPPIAPSEVFLPAMAVREIHKAPKEKRPILLKNFKEKLAYQKEGLALIQEKLIEKIRQNPDISFDELSSKLDEWGETCGVNWFQKELFKSVLEKYIEKHQEVRRWRREYPDDAMLYGILFGRMPKGPVEVVEGPMTLFFRVHNLEDYARVHSQSFLRNTEPTAEEIQEADKTGGCFIVSSLFPALQGTITVEKAEGRPIDANSQNTYLHEEQHAIKNLFNTVARDLSGLEEKIIEAVSPEEREQLIARYLRMDREYQENLAKGEILSFFRTGTSAEEIFDELAKSKENGGIYDYSANSIKREKKRLEELLMPRWGNEAPPLIKKAAEKVYGIEYSNLLFEAITACVALKELNYSVEQTIATLLPEPLRRWKKVVKRIIETKTNASQKTQQ